MHTRKISIFVVLASALTLLVSSTVFALGEGLEKVTDSVVDVAKDIGEGASELADDVKQSAGIDSTAAEINQRSQAALQKLYKSSPFALELSKKAKAILVFPKVIKAGFGVGGQYGEGALYQRGRVNGYYSLTAGSYGLQIGAQKYGYAMFFMDDKSLNYLLENNSGWEIGAGPSIVLVDEGMARSFTNTTVTESVYVFAFAQEGLMAGLGIQGSKISRIMPK